MLPLRPGPLGGLALQLTLLLLPLVLTLDREDAFLVKNDVSSPAKSLWQEKQQLKKDRVAKLESFFGNLNSPLVHDAGSFIDVADEHDLDWRLLPAIACKESGCGQLVPYNSYNPFGWGVYEDNYVSFPDWKSSIEEVGRGIKENYIDEGLTTPEQIEMVYTPSSIERGRTWSKGVNYYMDRLSNEGY